MGKDLNGKEIGKGFSQRKDGRYEARTTINGVKIHIYNMNLTQLKKEFEIAKAKLLREEKNIRPQLKLKEWFDEWFNNVKKPQLKSEASSKTYYRKINNTYISILGDKLIEDISQINVQTATNELVEKGYTERTVREALGVLKECFEIAIVNRIIPSNPCIGIAIRNANILKERRVLSHDEQETFLNEVKNNYYYEAYAILLSTGMRIGEFSGLQWNDIDFENKEIRINRSMSTTYIDGKKYEELTTPKTFNAYRAIPFFGETEQLLKSWKKKQNIYKKKLGNRWRANDEFGDLVFTSTMGSPVTRYVLAHDINKVVKDLKMKEILTAQKEGRQPKEIKGIHPHAFRHTFATRCFEKGIDPLVIQNMMGHSNYATTVSYTHVLKDKKQEEIEKVGRFLD